jgi:hypothetical protein
MRCADLSVRVSNTETDIRRDRGEGVSGSGLSRQMDDLEFFYIFILLLFSKNKWSNQNFREMYILRRTPRRQEPGSDSRVGWHGFF